MVKKVDASPARIPSGRTEDPPQVSPNLSLIQKARMNLPGLKSRYRKKQDNKLAAAVGTDDATRILHYAKTKRANANSALLAAKGRLEATKILLAHQADPLRALQQATTGELAQAALDHGADPSAGLHSAPNAEVFDVLLSGGADPVQALQVASTVDMARVALAHGADANSGLRPGIHAEMFGVLLEAGADPTRALPFASTVDMLRTALTHGADATTVLRQATTAEVARAALEHGANPDDAMHTAPNAEVMKVLLAAGGDVHLKRPGDGKTPAEVVYDRKDTKTLAVIHSHPGFNVSRYDVDLEKDLGNKAAMAKFAAGGSATPSRMLFKKTPQQFMAKVDRQAAFKQEDLIQKQILGSSGVSTQDFADSGGSSVSPATLETHGTDSPDSRIQRLMSAQLFPEERIRVGGLDQSWHGVVGELTTRQFQDLFPRLITSVMGAAPNRQMDMNSALIARCKDLDLPFVSIEVVDAMVNRLTVLVDEHRGAFGIGQLRSALDDLAAFKSAAIQDPQIVGKLDALRTTANASAPTGHGRTRGYF